jgi:hypothetical protein
MQAWMSSADDVLRLAYRGLEKGSHVAGLSAGSRVPLSKVAQSVHEGVAQRSAGSTKVLASRILINLEQGGGIARRRLITTGDDSAQDIVVVILRRDALVPALTLPVFCRTKVHCRRLLNLRSTRPSLCNGLSTAPLEQSRVSSLPISEFLSWSLAYESLQ